MSDKTKDSKGKNDKDVKDPTKEKIDDRHSWQEVRRWHPDDMRLRKQGFAIFSRKKDVEPRWLPHGKHDEKDAVSQSEAMVLCEQMEKEKQAVADAEAAAIQI